MKKLLLKDTKFLNRDLALLTGRIAIAVLMLMHGLPKFQLLLSGATIQFPSVFGMSPELSLTLAVFAEVFCSIFILTGLGTRIAVLPLIVTMLVAVLTIHAADGFSTKEPAILYLIGYIVLLFGGSGRYSLDQLFFSSKGTIKTIPAKDNDRSILNYS